MGVRQPVGRGEAQRASGKRFSDLENFSRVSIFSLHERGGQWRVARGCYNSETSRIPSRCPSSVCVCVCKDIGSRMYMLALRMACVRHLLEHSRMPSPQLTIVRLRLLHAECEFCVAIRQVKVWVLACSCRRVNLNSSCAHRGSLHLFRSISTVLLIVPSSLPTTHPPTHSSPVHTCNV